MQKLCTDFRLIFFSARIFETDTSCYRVEVVEGGVAKGCNKPRLSVGEINLKGVRLTRSLRRLQANR